MVRGKYFVPKSAVIPYGMGRGQTGIRKDNIIYLLMELVQWEEPYRKIHRRRSLPTMGTAIEYQKIMTEIVYINLPGPQEPLPNMTGGELLHGFLAELHRLSNADVREHVEALCSKWNIRFRDQKSTR
jgi:hypothetical protein